MTETDIRTLEIEHPDGIVPCHVSGSADAPAVLLLAGGDSASLDYFPRVREALPGCRVVGVDRPGTGRARGFTRTDLPYSCRVVADVLGTISTGPAIVVGHSFGGMAALQLALDAPAQVRALLLLDPTPFTDPIVMQIARAAVVGASTAAKVPGVAAKLEARHHATWRRSLGPLEPDAERSFDVITGDVDLRGDTSAIRHSSKDGKRLVARLAAVQCPVVILSADRKASSRSSRAYARLAQDVGGQVRVLPGTSHALQLQRPDDVIRAIRELLA